MNAAGAARAPRLGDLLLAHNLLNLDQLSIALAEQKKTGKPLGEVIVDLGFVDKVALSRVLASALGEEAIDLKNIFPSADALALIAKNVAVRCAAFPVQFDADTRELIVALADTHDVIAIDQISTLVAGRAKPRWRLASRTDILDAIERFYGYELSINGILQELETGQVDVAEVARAGGSYAHPVVRLVAAVLTDAVLREASDIHFEPEGLFVRIRYRIDGVLAEIRTLHISHWPGMLVRLKVMSGMDIAETRAPQDGRISLAVAGRTVDFRCACQPTIHGENYVLRILDKKKSIVPLDQLGLSAEQRRLVDLMLARPEGVLLVTGPTGSGKTTTLYSLLTHISTVQINVMTLEDPVEYPLPLIRQTQVGEAAKIDFASGVRSLMRQDPDVILVGEIRDRDTAEMTFRAAMTGHQVFSTLHTNSALRSVPRLIDLGIRPDVMAGNIIGIISQRLVRRLCPHCRRAVAPSPQQTHMFDQAGLPLPAQLFQPVGCNRCTGGYRSRFALMEIVRFDRALDDLIVSGATLGAIEAAARAGGFVPIGVDALRRIAEGATSLEEAARVVDLTVFQ